MRKIELKDLVGYLPYELNIVHNYITSRIERGDPLELHKTKMEHLHLSCFFRNDKFDYKPILRPLSDLTKEIEVNGEKLVPINFIPEYCLEYHSRHGKDRLFDNWANTLCVIEYIKPESLSYSSIQILLEYHFDIFGLIKENLAIDINNL